MPRALAALFALLLLGCHPAPKVHPALWEVAGAHGERAWLFGTIHSLPCPVDWRSAKIDAALQGSDRVVVEVAKIADTAAIAHEFAALAHSPGHPPLAQRLPRALAGKLGAMLNAGGFSPDSFGNTETWAAALQLAETQKSGASDAAYGIDRALLEAVPTKPVEEFEGAATQLSLFDRLPEADQRALLGAVVASSGSAATDTRALEAAWQRGDMAVIARDEQGGVLATPNLRAVLLTGRNRAWAAKLDAMLKHGARPFVAVGAGHMAGAGGLPALLAAQGYRVRRVQ